MLARKTIVDQLEILRDGAVNVRIALVIEDDGKVVTSKYHRTRCEPAVQPSLQMAAVNEHLAEMGEAPVSDEDIARVAAFHTLAVSYVNKPKSDPAVLES